MPSSDPWLARQNAALKLKGHGVTLDVAGSRVRLRATMPPRPTDPPGSAPKQQRISTGLVYPDQSSEALELAEKLGNALERHRVGAEAFDWSPWLPRGRKEGLAVVQTDQSVSISGRRAVRLTYEWWQKQRTRGPSAEETWKVGYQDPLSPLLEIDELTPDHLVALVETTKTPSRSRTRVAQATANVARALAWPDALVLRLREMGKGYSPYKSQLPRHLPTDEQIEQFIDSLSATWQWPVPSPAVDPGQTAGGAADLCHRLPPLSSPGIGYRLYVQVIQEFSTLRQRVAGKGLRENYPEQVAPALGPARKKRE